MTSGAERSLVSAFLSFIPFLISPRRASRPMAAAGGAAGIDGGGGGGGGGAPIVMDNKLTWTELS